MIVQKKSTDWLGSRPVFYNEKTGIISDNINEVINYRDLEIDPEGFNNYLDFGYSVFGQTPVKNVKFLEPNQVIENVNGKLVVNNLPDPVEKYLGRKANEDDVIDLIKLKVGRWEEESKGLIIIPTSGGYDSRLLNIFINDKSRIRSFTFGVSSEQEKSFEVVFAKELSVKLGTQWEQIELGEFHKYIDEWLSIYGPSSHAHGMYQIEFYNKIINKVDVNANLLSGIIGDGWSGNVVISPVNSVKDVTAIGYTHAMHSDSKFSKFPSIRSLTENYWDKNHKKFINDRWRIIESMRMKILLLSYLVKIPELMGFLTYSPFLDVEVACAMLNLPDERRQNRLWQKDYLKKNGLNLEEMGLKANKSSLLNFVGMCMVRLEPLRITILSELIDAKYLEWINKKVTSVELFPLLKLIQNVTDTLGLNVNTYNSNSEIIRAYCGYLTLKPIEDLLIKRNQS